MRAGEARPLRRVAEALLVPGVQVLKDAAGAARRLPEREQQLRTPRTSEAPRVSEGADRRAGDARAPRGPNLSPACLFPAKPSSLGALTWCSALLKRTRMTQSESSKEAMHPSDGSSSRIRARTNRFMSVSYTHLTLPTILLV